MTRAVGIDLGTSYTVVAVLEEGRPRVIPDAGGQLLTPSVVAFTNGGAPLVGSMAKLQAAANPGRTVFSIKRRMGSDYTVTIDGKRYKPQEISGFILRKVKADAEDYLGEKVDRVVITVPAYFSDLQRQATKEAGILAGLDVIRIINEPTAAALSYGLDRDDIHRILVWDLGGGTFDVSIMELEQGIFEVIAVSGNTQLGGDDVDRRIMDYLADQYEEMYRTNYPADATSRQRLREAAENAKIALSGEESVRIIIPAVERKNGSGRHLKAELTRHKMQELIQDILLKMLGPTKQAMNDAGLKVSDIDRMILVGGATRMPAVRELARQLMGNEPCTADNPDEIVALGAALQAGMLLGLSKKSILLDVLPLSLGIETQGGLFSRIIPRNTPLPAAESLIFTTARDFQTAVDVNVVQGEREICMDNISLGKFTLEDIPMLKMGEPKIEVSFEVDMDGILSVSALDLFTENSMNIKLSSPNQLTPEDVQRIISEAASSADMDHEKQDKIMADIAADNAITASDLFTQEYSGKYTDEDKENIWKAVLKVKEALSCEDTCQLKQKTDDLKSLMQAMSRTTCSPATRPVPAHP